jgi:hypothetical protein
MYEQHVTIGSHAKFVHPRDTNMFCVGDSPDPATLGRLSTSYVFEHFVMTGGDYGKMQVSMALNREIGVDKRDKNRWFFRN